MFDSYAILLGSRLSLKSYNECVDHRLRNYLKKGLKLQKKSFSQK